VGAVVLDRAWAPTSDTQGVQPQDSGRPRRTGRFKTTRVSNDNTAPLSTPFVDEGQAH